MLPVALTHGRQDKTDCGQTLKNLKSVPKAASGRDAVLMKSHESCMSGEVNADMPGY